MIAAVYHGPEDLRAEQWPTPSAATGEIVLRMEYASICATDLRIIRGAHRNYGPGTVRVPGHEVVATIAELGSGVNGRYRVGQRVFVAPNIGCGHAFSAGVAKTIVCRLLCARHNDGRGIRGIYQAAGSISRTGQFDSFRSIPGWRGDRSGRAVCCVLHGQDALRMSSEDVLLIMGPGPIGIMHVIAARAAGVKKILVSGKSPERLQMATAAGADRVVNILEENLGNVIATETEGRRADLIVVATGARKPLKKLLHWRRLGVESTCLPVFRQGNHNLAGCEPDSLQRTDHHRYHWLQH